MKRVSLLLLCLVALLATLTVAKSASASSSSSSLVDSRRGSSGRKLLALICDDGEDDDDDVPCCPNGCGSHGACIADKGCSCTTGWGFRNRWSDKFYHSCERPMTDYWTGNAYNFFMTIFSLLWFVVLVRGIVGLVLYLKESPKLGHYLLHGAVIWAALVKSLWIWVDAWGHRGIFPLFVDAWFNHMGWTFAVGAAFLTYWQWGTDSKDEGEDPPLAGVSKFIMLVLWVAVFVVQLAADAHTARTLYEWQVFGGFLIVFLIAGATMAFVNGVIAIKGGGSSDSSRFKEISRVVFVQGLMLMSLALANIGAEYRDRVGIPIDFYALAWFSELFQIIVCYSALFAVRPDAWDKILGKLPGREHEEKFASSAGGRADYDEGSKYKADRGGKLDRGGKSDATKVEYPDTNLSLSS